MTNYTRGFTYKIFNFAVKHKFARIHVLFNHGTELETATYKSTVTCVKFFYSTKLTNQTLKTFG